MEAGLSSSGKKYMRRKAAKTRTPKEQEELRAKGRTEREFLGIGTEDGILLGIGNYNAIQTIPWERVARRHFFRMTEDWTLSQTSQSFGAMVSHRKAYPSPQAHLKLRTTELRTIEGHFLTSLRSTFFFEQYVLIRHHVITK
jgi:hypothetical protein